MTDQTPNARAEPRALTHDEEMAEWKAENAGILSAATQSVRDAAIRCASQICEEIFTEESVTVADVAALICEHMTPAINAPITGKLPTPHT